MRAGWMQGGREVGMGGWKVGGGQGGSELGMGR